MGIKNWQGSDPLTVTLKDSANVVKEEVTGVTPRAYGSTTWVYFNSATMLPGDKITVTDGVKTASMTVSSLATRLNTATAHLTGTSSNGHLMATLYDFQRDQANWGWYCADSQVSGSFNVAFTGAQIGPQDDASAYLTGADGHFTYEYVNAFTLDINRNTASITGYTEVPGSSVTVTAKRGGATLDTQTKTSSLSGGYFYFNLAITGALLTGDVLEVTTNEGSSATLTIPELTLNSDPVNQRLYGVAPASQPLTLELGAVTGSYDSTSHEWLTTADATGQYSSSTIGQLFYQCQPVIPGSLCTKAWLFYYYPVKEHEIEIYSSNAADVADDAFEPDDYSDSASTYTTVQAHTFSNYDDEDWAMFTVSQADVDAGVAYQIRTFNLGPYMDTKLELYDTDGSTKLAENDDVSANSTASLILWKPSAAGTFYVRMLPYDESKTEYCGAFYSLGIQVIRSQVYIPVVLR